MYSQSFSPLILYYWRDKNDEVDYILERRGAVLAIELKSGRLNLNWMELLWIM